MNVLENPRMRLLSLLLVSSVALFAYAGYSLGLYGLTISTVSATVETLPVSTAGDVAGELVIWVHPVNPARSTLVGTNTEGLVVYDLRGNVLQYQQDGKFSSLDLRSGFLLDKQPIGLITGVNRSENRLAIYSIDPGTRQIAEVTARRIDLARNVDASCMYYSQRNDRYYVYTLAENGAVEQWELFDNNTGGIDALKVGRFEVSSQLEDCVADDELAVVYFASKQQGVWRLDAEPNESKIAPVIIDKVNSGGPLKSDVGTLALYTAPNGVGYLIVASHSGNEYVLYQRNRSNKYVTTFRLIASKAIDEVSNSAGIAVTHLPLGQDFPQGLFVAHDHSNDDGQHNYKLVPWQALANGLNPLLAPGATSTAFEPTGQMTGTVPRPTDTVYLPQIEVRAGARGYLTTPQELLGIQQKADQGFEPYKNAVADVLAWAEKKWDYTLKENETCKSADKPAWNDETGGTPVLYAKALAYHLTHYSQYAADVKEILQRIMTEVKTIDIDDRQCRLNFSWGTPELVASADLIEEYWIHLTCTGPTSTAYADTTLGSGPCKKLFQNWLVKNPYYIASYAGEETQSNWGAAATNLMAYIADYLWDRPEVQLIRRNPPQVSKREEVAESASAAFAHANQLALDRMNGYRVDYLNTSCGYLYGQQQSDLYPPVASMITENGIITEDARREEYCNIPKYNGQYQNYPEIHLGNNIQQCELMLRRGDRSCFDNVDNTDLPNYTYLDPDGLLKTTHLYPGRGSIERAINAIIIDAGTEWKRTSALEVAYRYYYKHQRLGGVEQWFHKLDRPGVCRQDICFGTLTHGFAPGENPELPPTISPP